MFFLEMLIIKWFFCRKFALYYIFKNKDRTRMTWKQTGWHPILYTL